MPRRFAIRGGTKWIILMAAVAALEIFPGPTLSSSHIQAIDFKHAKGPLVLAAEVYLMAHLWRMIPPRLDPLRNLDKIKVARNVIA